MLDIGSAFEDSFQSHVDVTPVALKPAFENSSGHESAYIKLGCFGAVKGGSGPIRTREQAKESGGKYH